MSSFLVALSRNSTSRGLVLLLSLVFPILNIFLMYLPSQFTFRTSLKSSSTVVLSSVILCSPVASWLSSNLWITMLFILSSLLLSSSAVSFIFSSTCFILSFTVFNSLSIVFLTIVVHSASFSLLLSPLFSPLISFISSSILSSLIRSSFCRCFSYVSCVVLTSISPSIFFSISSILLSCSSILSSSLSILQQFLQSSPKLSIPPIISHFPHFFRFFSVSAIPRPFNISSI